MTFKYNIIVTISWVLLMAGIGATFAGLTPLWLFATVAGLPGAVWSIRATFAAMNELTDTIENYLGVNK